jgi:acetylglutamate/LysW-gamma-L-alpha-aminoadipate kinase
MMNPTEPLYGQDTSSTNKNHSQKLPIKLVVKIGGTTGVDFSAICQNVVALKSSSCEVILVHGGSAEANDLGEAVGIPPRFVTSPSGYTSRYTDRKTLEVFLMAVNGKVNTLLVEQLQRLGVNAFGLSGLDGRVIRAKRKSAIQIVENGKRKVLRDDYTGRIQSVNIDVLSLLMASGNLPVIAPIAVSEKGEALNVDADRAAAMIAAAVGADVLLLLTAVPGLLKHYPDENSLIKALSRSQLDSALELARGRMKKKILGSREALEGGVQKVIIGDGRIEQPIFNALSGMGTTIQ